MAQLRTWGVHKAPRYLVVKKLKYQGITYRTYLTKHFSYDYKANNILMDAFKDSLEAHNFMLKTMEYDKQTAIEGYEFEYEIEELKED